MSDCMTPEKVNEGFLTGQPAIAQQILDLSVKHPNWMRDLFETEEFPRGEGAVLQQLVFKGARPRITRGFDTWKKVGNLSGCNPCDAPDCGYNWEEMGGHAFERKVTEFMTKDFRSPSYCVKEIQTTRNFKEVFAKTIENLYAQTDFYKEFNIGQNFLTAIAKKYVVDSSGPRPNTQNPYVYRAPGVAELSTLNMGLLEYFYEHMRRYPSCIPLDVVDGAPLFAIIGSHQLFSRLYLDDPNIRQDARFSGYATDLLTKYNFQSTLRGMFLPAPILYPRRFNLNILNGQFEEVLPFINDIPGEIGAYTDINPDYMEATHEEVILHGLSPFKVFYMPTESSLGGGSEFGPEQSFMNSWQWINPQTTSDPGRRVGYYWTSATIGLSQQFSEGVFGILVARPRTDTVAMYTPRPVCPTEIPTCTNTVPDVDCPCAVVLGITADPFVVGNYTLTFATPITGLVGHNIVLELDNRTTVTGEIVQITTDGLIAQISFDPDLPLGICSHIVRVSCSPTLSCTATVQIASDCRSDQTGEVSLTLSNAIRASVGETITLYFGDCTTAGAEIKSIDSESLIYNVSYDTGYGPTDDPDGNGATELNADMICDRGGIAKVCVPPSTDATCPPCEATLTACVNEVPPT